MDIQNRVQKRFKWARLRFKMTPYVFISPFFIAFLVFSAFPIIYSLVLSVHSWNGIREMKFNGLDNFIYIFKDPLFWMTLKNTLLMLLIGALPSTVLALCFAFLLNQAYIKMKNIFKGILFLPYITSAVAVALVFGIFYGREYGFINFLYKQTIEMLNGVFGMGIVYEPIKWLKGDLTLFSVSFLSIWRWTGWNTLLFLAGMQAISPSLYEAAEIDGASKWQQFLRITVPLLKPILFFSVTMAIIGGMQAFDDPMVLLGADGGAGNNFKGITSSVYIYNNAFRWGYYGIASAASYVLFVVILFLSWVNKRIFSEKRKSRKVKKG